MSVTYTATLTMREETVLYLAGYEGRLVLSVVRSERCRGPRVVTDAWR
jgi:hypothetical protein